MAGRRFNAAQSAALEQLKELLAAFRAAYLTYRTAHWQAKGDAYYGDHLLLERIYEETEKHVDQLAERVVGYYGGAAVDLADQAERIAGWAEEFGAEREPIRASLTAAETLRDLLDETYRMLKQEGSMTLGLDDLLMSISSDKDQHIYLLQRALEGRSVARAKVRAANAGHRRTRWRFGR